MAKVSIDPDVIRTLASLLDETDLTEIEWEEGDQRIRVARGGTVVATSAPAQATSPAASAKPQEPAATPSATQANPTGAVTSPMVGTAYLSPEPGAKPFVSVGDQVSEGQTLLIIEAMKTMNPIAAPRGGTVSQVLVDDSTPVEYGQPLVVVE